MSGELPQAVIQALDRLIKEAATGHITLHVKDGRLMEVETLVKKRI